MLFWLTICDMVTGKEQEQITNALKACCSQVPAQHFASQAFPWSQRAALLVPFKSRPAVSARKGRQQKASRAKSPHLHCLSVKPLGCSVNCCCMRILILFALLLAGNALSDRCCRDVLALAEGLR